MGNVTGLPSESYYLLVERAHELYIEGDNARAKGALILAIKVAGRYQGHFSQRVGMILHRLGKVTAAMDQNEEALRYFEFAAHIRLNGLSIDLGLVYYDEGVLLVNMGRYREGLYYLGRSLRILFGTFGNIHPLVCDCLRNMARAYFAVGNYEMYWACMIASWRGVNWIVVGGEGVAPAA